MTGISSTNSALIAMHMQATLAYSFPGEDDTTAPALPAAHASMPALEVTKHCSMGPAAVRLEHHDRAAF